MAFSDPGPDDVRPEPDSAFATPLGKWQRAAATTLGLVLTSIGVVSVFLDRNQAGSVALLLGGFVFLLIAVVGLSLHRVRFRELELFFGIRQRERVSELASRLPHSEAARLMELLQETRDGAPYNDPQLVLIDSLLFEARVRDAVTVALDDAERVEVNPDAGTGEPLIHVIRPDGVRIGLFAMFAPSEHGSLTPEFDDEFVDILPRTGTDAVILISCVRDGGYLAALAERVRAEAGLPVSVEDWRPRGEARPLRPVVDRLCAEIHAVRAVPPSRGSGPANAGPGPTR